MFETQGLYYSKSYAQKMNDYTFTDYFYRLNLIARSIFQWDGLPDGINEKWIERFLFNEGSCIFFKDKTFGFMVSKCTQAGELNYYDEPTLLMPVATGYCDTSPLKNGEECVLMCNNDLMLPTKNTIILNSYRLAEITRAIDVNINAQKTPVLIKGSEKQMNSLKTVYNQWDGNKPVIFGDKTLENDMMSVLKTDAPVVFDKLQIQKHEILNEIYTFLGINNANMNKRERLVDDEVQANNEQIALSADIMLKAREQACKEINNLFGLNISVKKREITPEEFQIKGGVNE